jgi:hypothetical protein
MLSLRNIEWRDEPYPIALAKPVFEPDVYERMVVAFPPLDLFMRMGSNGYSKWSLSERFHAKGYHVFVAASPVWSEFHEYVKRGGLWEDVCRVVMPTKSGVYSTRFEFSAMPAAGGFIAPHTDLKSKVITLVVPMLCPGEWEASYGGGTDILIPLVDDAKDYQTPRSSFKLVHSYPYEPNQAVVFVRSDKSWHSVGPMTGPDGAMRRTLTINIERT